MDMVEDTMELFMDDLLVMGYTYEAFLDHLSEVLHRYLETNLKLTLEKCRLMVKEGIIKGHKITNNVSI